MSSRALRRLQQDATVIKVSGKGELSSEEEEDDQPGFSSNLVKKKKSGALNPFSMLVGEEGEGEEHESDRDGDAEEEENGSSASKPPAHTAMKKKKKKRKKSRQSKEDQTEESEEKGLEEIDAAIKEVNELLGEVEPSSSATASSVATDALLGEKASYDVAAAATRSLLSVERRFLNAENELKKIFGSKVVRAEAGRHRAHRRVHHKMVMFASPKDTWPKMDKTGLSMELTDSKNGCQCFAFKHSSEYQRTQMQFLDAVETFDPNAIAAVLHAHPYHIDSLLQLSEVCKMSEDLQMATELLERALFCFENSFHTLFNVAHGNCRLRYTVAENRPLFIALFRHLYYIGRKGCHRTAFEFCKLLLSLEPEGDPLCVLLMIDYYALRANECSYLLKLFKEWESERNLSQLPNFAFSIPLAMFNNDDSTAAESAGSPSAAAVSSEVGGASARLQEALLMFPNILLPLMDKCQVTLDPVVMQHPYFTGWNLKRDPQALQLLQTLFIERSYSLWKVPEVLTWLEENARLVVARVDSKDTAVADYSEKRGRRYSGAPRNVCRHVILSDYDQVTALLPKDLSKSDNIMMYDPLPPPDSTSSYPESARRTRPQGAAENPLLLFLRSMLPTFENIQRQVPGGAPVPQVQRLQEHIAAQQEAQALEAQAGVGRPEGSPGQPLDIQASLNSLVGMLQRVLEFIPSRGDSDGYDSTSSSSSREHT